MTPKENSDSRCHLGTAMWPVVSLIVFLCLVGPIRSLITSFSALAQNSQRVSVGAFTLELGRLSEQAGDPTLRDALAGLTFDELFYFLVVGGEYGDETAYKPPLSSKRAERIQDQLVRRGLLEVLSRSSSPPPEGSIWKDGKGEYVMFKTTEKGRQIHSVIMTALQTQWTFSKQQSGQQ